MEFTKEIKTKWLDALKSGKYKQIQRGFKKNGGHCCLGVLDDLIISENNGNLNAVWPLLGTIPNHDEGVSITTYLVQLNDAKRLVKPDYSNVIPFIEKLETVD